MRLVEDHWSKVAMNLDVTLIFRTTTQVWQLESL
jgi:hypothetical protein